MTGNTGRASRLGVGDLAIVAAAVGYGLSTTISVAALDRVRPADLVSVELTGGAMALLAVAAVRGQLSLRGARRNFLLGAMMPGLAFVLGDVGLSMTSATAGSLLLAVDLPLSVLLSVLFLREVLSAWSAVALVLGLAGTAVVALGAGHQSAGASSVVGNLLVIASICAAGAFLVITRIHNDGDGLNASAWQTAGGAVCTLPFVLGTWVHSGSRLPGTGAAGWALCIGVLACTAVASVSFNWGISRVPGVRASQLQNVTPLAGLVAAVVILREQPSPAQIIGGALVLLAVLVLVQVTEADAPPPVLDEDAPECIAHSIS